MRMILWMLLMIATLPLGVCSQTPEQDVVILKNGSRLRGIITGTSEGVIRLNMAGGNMLVLDISEVDTLYRQKTRRKDRLFDLIPGAKGYFGKVGFHGLFSDHPYDDGLSRAYAIRSVNGYYFFRQFAAGLEAGLDIYPDYDVLFIPLQLHVEGALLNRRIFPVYQAAIGYGFGFIPQALANDVAGFSEKHTGGISFYAAGGAGLLNDHGIYFSILMGYYQQRGQYDYSWDWGGEFSELRIYKRIMIGVTAGW